MSKTYNVELSEQGIKSLKDTLNKINKKLDNDGFNKFLMAKCKEELENIMYYEDVDGDQRGAEYIAGNHDKTGKDYVHLYNDSEIDIESQDTWLNDWGKNYYPEKLSLAELIEYGTGLVGAQSSKNTGDEWEYMANPKRKDGTLRSYEDGWEWNNESYPSSPTPTTGQEGRYIYFQLAEKVRANLDKWVEEYINELIGGSL